MSQALPYHATRTRPVTRQGKAQTDSEDQDGEQQTTPPTPRVRCSIHPDPPAYQEPVQASRPKGHLKVSQSTGRDSPPGPTLPRNRPSQVTRQGKTRTNSEDPNGEQQTPRPPPRSVAQATPILQLIGSPSKPPVQRAICKKVSIYIKLTISYPRPNPTTQPAKPGHSARENSNQ